MSRVIHLRMTDEEIDAMRDGGSFWRSLIAAYETVRLGGRFRVKVKPGSDPAALKPLIQTLGRIAVRMLRASGPTEPMDVPMGTMMG
jgi:hypothetical protein